MLGGPCLGFETKELQVKRRRRYLNVLLASAVAVLAIWWLLTLRVPPEAITRGRMRLVATRINLYTEQHGNPPVGLQGLPTLPGKDNRVQDAWGREIQYRQRPDGALTLRSYGADGEPGGRGADGDLELTWKARHTPAVISTPGE